MLADVVLRNEFVTKFVNIREVDEIVEIELIDSVVSLKS